MPKDQLRVMGDIVDQQLVTCDGRRLGRVADVEAELRDDGSLVLTHLVTGPQALAARLSSHLRPPARFVLRDRFERRIPLIEVEEIAIGVRLRGTAEDYAVGASERWIADHILRFIPGGGR